MYCITLAPLMSTSDYIMGSICLVISDVFGDILVLTPEKLLLVVKSNAQFLVVTNCFWHHHPSG